MVFYIYFWAKLCSLQASRGLSGRLHLPTQETQETQVQSLGWENLLEEEMATQSSILA